MKKRFLFILSIGSFLLLWGCSNFETSYMKTDLGNEDIQVKVRLTKDNATLSYQSVVNELIIPELVAGKSVVKVELKGAAGLSTMKTIAFPNTVEEIDTFEGCKNLEKICVVGNASEYSVLPASLGTVPSFKDCAKLERIILKEGIELSPDTVTFEGCSSLTELKNFESVKINTGNDKYGDNEKSPTVKLPKDFFKNCSKLESISLPEGVTVLEQNVFRGCKALKTILLPEEISELAEGLFYDCSALEKITIADSDRLIKIGNSVFYNCKKLTAFNLSENEKFKELPKEVFSGCEALESIKIPDNVISVGDSCFKGCKKLASVILSNSMTRLSDNLFYECSNLEQIVIPEKIESIGDSSLAKCDKLEKIYFKSPTAPEIGKDNLKKDLVIVIPAGCLDAYKEAWKEILTEDLSIVFEEEVL
ncbi:MAG: leucine-rich repeat domain-containing protein [Treponema sp.]|nr:leucine-rich repeat domain-containing protein [Treponema sp.]